MDIGFWLNLLYELAYLIAVFSLVSVYTFAKGRQALINLIFGLYLALLITLEFPFRAWLFGADDSQTVLPIVFFVVVTALTTWLCFRVMPDEFNERRFESVGKKVLLTTAATILIMIFSFHVLPVTDILTPGTPIQSLFAPAEYFFWWLITPLAILVFM